MPASCQTAINDCTCTACDAADPTPSSLHLHTFTIPAFAGMPVGLWRARDGRSVLFCFTSSLPVMHMVLPGHHRNQNHDQPIRGQPQEADKPNVLHGASSKPNVSLPRRHSGVHALPELLRRSPEHAHVPHMSSKSAGQPPILRQHRHPAFPASCTHILQRMIDAQSDVSTGAMGYTLDMTVILVLGHSYGFISLHRTEQTGQCSEHVCQCAHGYCGAKLHCFQ